ncbi:GIY-YIG nuclease family protein [Muriicola sp. Z0-33]|nr:GIY-YIG nuclease family protein [Muriicola sp. Z0-33]
MTNNRNSVVYIGVTSNLVRRIWQHKNKILKGFTSRYNCYKLVYYESFDHILDAINREKQLKAGNRKRKLDLVNSLNPKWYDLSEGWIE